MKHKFIQYAIAAVLLHGSLNSIAQQNANAFIGPEKGALVIVGGGKLGPDIWNRFIELAGGANAHIVVIPTAAEDSSVNTGKFSEVEVLKGLGVQDVTVLHTRDPKTSNTESFVSPLRKATGIWFSGGRQWRLADAYLNTLAHKEFEALLKRNGVIGGTSAGATIQGSFLLRGDTKGNTTLVGDHVQGLDFIHKVAIDQHVLRRNRQFDLIQIIKERPELLGIGIDENTAIVVQKNTFDVIGSSYVAIYEAAKTTPFYFLGKGQQYDLKERKIIQGVTTTQ